MNNLNSVIVEGVVSTGVNNDGLFTIKTTRYYKVGEEFNGENTFVECLVTGSLRDFVKVKLTEGRGVRIVGYLKEIEGNLGLFVEHVEFKPLVRFEGKYTFKNN